MFDKILSKVGVGAAKVDTTLHNPEIVRGEFLEGEVKMVGGKIDQEIKRVYIQLYTSYTYEGEEHDGIATAVLHELNISEAFTLHAGEEVIFDFELEVPWVTPVSFQKQEVRLKTGLDVSWAFDPKDNDIVEVLPDPATNNLIAAAQDLGFEHTHESGRCFQMSNPYDVPYVQGFSFKAHGEIGREVEELDILVFAGEEQAEVILEIDERNRGMMGHIRDEMDMDEHQVRFTLAHDVEFGPDELWGIIQEVMG